MRLISLYFLCGIAFVYFLEWNYREYSKELKKEGIKIQRFQWNHRVFHILLWPLGILVIIKNLVKTIFK